MTTTKLENKFTPGGRLVMGSMTQKETKDQKGQPIPEDKQRYFFGVAVPKATTGVTELIQEVFNMAATDYASVPLVMNEIAQGLVANNFSWKIADGDAPQFDKKTGQPREIPDYIKGHYIFKFSTQFEFGACDAAGVDINRADIKKGDYVDVMFNSQINGQVDHTAGVYLNPLAIRRLGFGDPIASGMSASQAFANSVAAIPAGASQMPTAGGAVPPAAPAVAAPAVAAPAVAAPAVAAPAVPQPAATAAAIPTAPAVNPVPAGGPVAAPAVPGVVPQATSTASPTNPAVVPHPTILQGPTG